MSIVARRGEKAVSLYHNPDAVLNFGKFKGWKWRNIPHHYLRWIMQARHYSEEDASDELLRREKSIKGFVLEPPAVQESEQNIKLNELYRKTRGEEENYYSWLIRMASEAMNDSNTTIISSSKKENTYIGDKLRFDIIIKRKFFIGKKIKTIVKIVLARKLNHLSGLG